MFDKEFIKKLGKKDIGRDAALVKERVNFAWKRTSKEKQREVSEIADVSYNTIYRVRMTGIITPRMTIAFAQVLNIDPYYLIGATSENNGYSFKAAKMLLSELKYAKAVLEYDRAHPEPAEKPSENDTSAETEQEAAEQIGGPELTAQAAIQKLSEEDMVILLRSLMIKAGTGKPAALAAVTKITELLLL